MDESLTIECRLGSNVLGRETTRWEILVQREVTSMDHNNIRIQKRESNYIISRKSLI